MPSYRSRCAHCGGNVCSGCSSCNSGTFCTTMCWGKPGPPGPPGPPGAGSLLSGFQAQLSNGASGLVRDNQNILFDLVINQTGSDISYNQQTGGFLLPVNKNYYVSWWVSVDGTETAPIIEFAAAINNQPIAVASTPLVTCQLSGSALISVRQAPQILSIKNVSRDVVRYAATSIQANIVIVELNSISGQ